MNTMTKQFVQKNYFGGNLEELTAKELTPIYNAILGKTIKLVPNKAKAVEEIRTAYDSLPDEELKPEPKPKTNGEARETAKLAEELGYTPQKLRRLMRSAGYHAPYHRADVMKVLHHRQ